AREWMTRALHGRRDPAWTADGYVSDRWLPVSPVTHRLDAFAWKDPLSGHDGEGRVIEVDKGERLVFAPPQPAVEPPPAPERPDERERALAPEPRVRRARPGAPLP